MTKKTKTPGAAPYGYIKTDDGFALHPEEAPIRKLMFELFLTHKRKLTVANILNQKGYRTRNGAKFSDTSVDRLLRDPIAKGNHKDNFADKHGPAPYRALKAEPERKYPAIEPIVSEDRVNDLLVPKKKRTTKKHAGVFGNLITCSCGHKMHIPHGRKAYACTSCDGKIDARVLTKIVTSEFEKFKIDEKEAESFQNSHTNDDKTHLLTNTKKSLEREIDKLYDLYISGDIAKARFSQKNTNLEERLATVEDEIASLHEKDMDIPSTLGEGFISLPKKKQQLLADLLIQNISVKKDTLNITFGISPTLF